MTSANNDIQALIAKQILARHEPALVANISPLLKATQASHTKDNASAPVCSPLDGGLSVNLIAPPVAASVQTHAAPEQPRSMTELLIRIRELASEALQNIGTGDGADDPASTRMAKLDTAISAIDEYCKELTLQINQSSPTNSDQSDPPLPHAPIMNAQYAQTASALARAEIEQHAGKPLLAQANQRPAFVMALLH